MIKNLINNIFLGLLCLAGIGVVSSCDDNDSPESEIQQDWVVTGDINLEDCSVTCNVNEGIRTDGISRFGICYGTSSSPTTNDMVVSTSVLDKGDSFTLKLTGIPFSKVYYRAFVEKDGSINYGEVKSFGGNSIVTGMIDETTYTLCPRIAYPYSLSDCESVIYGVCYGTKGAPTENDLTVTTEAVDKLGNFFITLQKIPFGTIYYRAFVKIDGEIHYGETGSFEGYSMIVVKPADIHADWDEWKPQITHNWYTFYETVGHLQTRYILQELDRMEIPNRVQELNDIYILGVGEYPSDNWTIENIWEVEPNKGGRDDHAAMMTQKVKTVSGFPGIAQMYPNKIRWIPDGGWVAVLDYVKANPDKRFIIMRASDSISDSEYSSEWIEVIALKELVDMDNAWTICAEGNVNEWADYTLEASQMPRDRGWYRSASFQGKHSCAAVGGDFDRVSFETYAVNQEQNPSRPIGFTEESLVVSTGCYPYWECGAYGAGTTHATSPATAELTGTLWNIVALKPSMSFDDLKVLINKYIITIPGYFNDERIEDFHAPDQKKICKELLLPAFPAELSAQDVTVLPKSDTYPAVLWSGEGVECLIDGKWMPVTNDILERKGLYEICRFSTFRFNPDLFRIQGVQDKASMKVQLITTAGESIPEMEDDLTIALL